VITTTPEKENVILIGAACPWSDRSEIEATIDELANLAESAGAEIKSRIIQNVKRFDPAYFIGKGKAQEIAGLIRDNGVDAVIFDDDLTPAQVKNLSNVIKRKIIDRTGLILEIFAQNARTREAKVQVEIAQLEYQLPRLTGQWSHLERQVGGIGVRGPGETQLETDRRLVRKRLKKLTADLQAIDKQRNLRQSRRKNIFKATLVGYTNAGKSTLFNAITDAGALVEDRLFATLDSTVRRLELENNQILLLADTVGFIRKLPHSLIASFRSTLGVVRDADVLLHVVDLSSSNYGQQIEAVNAVLKDLNIDKKPVILVFNKIDLVDNNEILQRAKGEFPKAVFISAGRGIGINGLLGIISAKASEGFSVREYSIPVSDSKTISQLYELGDVIGQTFNGDYTRLRVRISMYNAAIFESTMESEQQHETVKQ